MIIFGLIQSPIRSLGRLPVALGSLNKIPCHIRTAPTWNYFYFFVQVGVRNDFRSDGVKIGGGTPADNGAREQCGFYLEHARDASQDLLVPAAVTS